MNSGGSRIWHHLIRILCLDSDAANYVDEIKKSEAFDEHFYKAQRPKNLWVQIFPIRHYVNWGEEQGLWPNSSFSPSAYIQNGHFLNQRIDRPLQHYLSYGKALNLRATPAPEDPTTLPADLEALPLIQSMASAKHPSRLAVVVHVYHYELWQEIAEVLTNLSEPFDLYCTMIKRAGFDQLVQEIKGRFSGAQVLCYPNHGRDIFPFVHLVNNGLLFKYAAVCKLHTKKSDHLDDGGKWRNALIQGLLPDKGSTDSLLHAFLGDPSLGAWVSDDQLLEHRHFWGPNRERVEHELGRIGIEAKRYKLSFPGGSMFWIKPQALHLLGSLNYTAADFEREEGQLDGTLAHAVERMMGFLVQHSGQKLVEMSKLAKIARMQKTA